MSLIEQAAKRLEQLRQAGVGSGKAEAPAEPPAASPPAADRVPTPEAAVRFVAPSVQELMKPATASPATPAPVAAAPVTPLHPEHAPVTRSRRVDIDLDHLRARGFVTPDATRSQIAEEYRVIKRPIMRNARDKHVRNGNLVMVTSALPGEGKSFTAINLAISIASEVGTTVLLIDGDVAHPDLPDQLGVPNEPGFLDVLQNDNIGIEDVLMRTSIDNLAVIPAGARHRRATELLASEQMASLLRELSTRYSDRIIIFDSPPLLPTTEARVLATHMGQVVMVVAADNTRHQTVNLALATIESCEIVLMLLNKTDKSSAGSYYGYYPADA
jgi:protein-tyrosine kinase